MALANHPDPPPLHGENSPNSSNSIIRDDEDEREDGEVEDGEITDEEEQKVALVRELAEIEKEISEENHMTKVGLDIPEQDEFSYEEQKIEPSRKRRRKRSKRKLVSDEEAAEEGNENGTSDRAKKKKHRSRSRYVDYDRVNMEDMGENWFNPPAEFDAGPPEMYLDQQAGGDYYDERVAPAGERHEKKKKRRKKSSPGLYDSPYESGDTEEDEKVEGAGDKGRKRRHKRSRKRDSSRRHKHGSSNSYKRPVQICRFYLEGRCTKQADECPFSHDAVQDFKDEVCKFYLNDGFCSKEDCVYMHEEFPCKFFHTTNTCYLGDRCKFSHDPLTEETSRILDRIVNEDEPERDARPKDIKMTSSTAGIPSIFDLKLDRPPPMKVQPLEYSRPNFYSDILPGTPPKVLPINIRPPVMATPPSMIIPPMFNMPPPPQLSALPMGIHPLPTPSFIPPPFTVPKEIMSNSGISAPLLSMLATMQTLAPPLQQQMMATYLNITFPPDVAVKMMEHIMKTGPQAFVEILMANQAGGGVKVVGEGVQQAPPAMVQQKDTTSQESKSEVSSKEVPEVPDKTTEPAKIEPAASSPHKGNEKSPVISIRSPTSSDQKDSDSDDQKQPVAPSVEGGSSEGDGAKIPMHLPKKQRELFMRIHQANHQREKESSEKEESPNPLLNENWYSSDEEDEKPKVKSEPVAPPVVATPPKTPEKEKEKGKETKPASKSFNVFDITKMLTDIKKQADSAQKSAKTSKENSCVVNNIDDLNKPAWKPTPVVASASKDPRMYRSRGHERKEPKHISLEKKDEAIHDPRVHKNTSSSSSDPRKNNHKSAVPPPAGTKTPSATLGSLLNLVPKPESKSPPYKLHSVLTKPPNYSQLVSSTTDPRLFTKPEFLKDPRLNRQKNGGKSPSGGDVPMEMLSALDKDERQLPAMWGHSEGSKDVDMRIMPHGFQKAKRGDEKSKAKVKQGERKSSVDYSSSSSEGKGSMGVDVDMRQLESLFPPPPPTKVDIFARSQTNSEKDSVR